MGNSVAVDSGSRRLGYMDRHEATTRRFRKSGRQIIRDGKEQPNQVHEQQCEAWKIGDFAHGGHRVEVHVMPALEVILTESPKHLQRTVDPETGLALIDLAK